MLRKIALTTAVTMFSTCSLFANQNPQINLKPTKINFSVQTGTQAKPEIAIAYSADITRVHQKPDVYWEASEDGIINGKKDNNIHNASVDQFLKLNGNEASFTVLVDNGSGEGYIPAMILNKYGKQSLASPFNLTKGQIKNCTVSFIRYSEFTTDGVWTASCES